MSGKFKKSDQTGPPNNRSNREQTVEEETVVVQTSITFSELEVENQSEIKQKVVPPGLTYESIVGETFHHQQHQGQPAVPPQQPVMKLESYKRDGLSIIEGILDGDWRRKAPPKPNSSGGPNVQAKTEAQSSSGQSGKQPQGPSTVQISAQSSQVGRGKATGRQGVADRPELRLPILFYRLVMKKKCQSQLGLAFSRLLLNNQKGKTIKNRISALSSTFNHLKRSKLSQAFSLIACAKSKVVQVLTPRQPSSPMNTLGQRQQRQLSGSHSRLPRTSRNRHEMRGTERSITSLPQQGKEDYSKLMTLSEEAKQALMKFQRFDRYIYPIESQKHLKAPIEAELSRLQKIKSGHKGMWNTMYENQLTITCLYNHMKNLYELNRQLSQLDQLKGANQQLQERIKQINIQKAKQLMDLKRKGFGGGVSASDAASSADLQKLKEYQRNTEFLISTLKETNQKARKLLQTQLKKASNPHKELLEIVSDMITELVQFEEMSNQSQALQNALNKLTEQQNDTARTIQNLERQKKVFEKAISDNKSAESINVNQVLLNMCNYLITLQTTIKNLKGQGSNRNLNQGEISRLRSQLDSQRTKNRELETKIQQLIKEKKVLEQSRDMVILTTWETELTTIIEKSQAKQAYQADITKQRRLLTTRKDNKFNNIITLNLTLLENMLKKDREIERLEKITQDKPQASSTNKVLQDKINKEKLRAENAEAEIARLKAQIEEYRKRENERGNQKDPLQTQLNELFKICTAFEQAATKTETEESEIKPNNTQALELVKHRKALENRKRGTPALLPIITLLDTLMKIIVELQSVQKKRQQDQERAQLQRTKQLTSIDNLTKTFMKLIQAENTKIDENLINRLRKNIDITTGKIDKGSDSPLSDVYEMYRNVVEVEGRLITLLEQVIRSAKEESSTNQKQATQNTDRKTKQQQEAQNRKITQLEKQLEIEKGRFATRETEMTRLKQLQIENGKKIGQLEKLLELEKNKMANKQRDITNKDEELKRLRAEIAAKQQEIRNNKLQLSKKEQEANAARNESSRKGDLDKEMKAAKETIQKHIESEKQLNKRIGQLERGETEFKRQTNDLQRQLNDFQKQIGQLQRQIGGLQKQCADGNESIEELERTNGELVNRVTELTRQIDHGGKQNQSQKNRMRQISDQLVEANRQIRDLNLQSKELTSQNGNLTAQNTNLTNQNRDLTAQLKDLSNQVKNLNNDIRKLNNQIADLSNSNTQLTHINDGLRKDIEQVANKNNQSSQQQLAQLRQQKLQLQANLVTAQREKAQLQVQFQRQKSQLESANEKLQWQIETLEANLDKLQKEKGQAQSGIQASYLRQKNQLQDTIQKLQRDKANIDAELARIGRQKKQLENALDKLSRQKSHAEASLSQSQREKSQLSATIERLQQQKNNNQSSKDSFVKQRAQLQAQIDRLARQKAQHQANSERIQRDYVELQKSQATLNVTVRTTKNDLDNANRNMRQLTSDLQRQQRQVQRLKEEVQRLQNDLRNNSTNNSRSQSQVSELRNQIIILQRKIVTLQASANNIRYLEEANRSLKDQNDMLREELIARGKNYHGQTTDSTKLSSLTQQVSRLQFELSKKSTQVETSAAEVKRLNNLINANEATFNSLLRDNQIMLQDNQAFFNDITKYKEIIGQLQRKLNDTGRVVDTSTQFKNKETRYVEEIRVLKLDKSNLERDIINLKNSQLSNISEKETKLRNQKSQLQRQAMIRQNELTQLRNKVNRLTNVETQYQSVQSDLNRLRIQSSNKEETYKRTIRDLESRENDLRRLVDSNASQYSQSQQKLNIEITNLRTQLNNRSTTTSSNNQQLLKSLSDQNIRINALERELSDARNINSRLQIEKNQLESQVAQRKKDYDTIIYELETRQRGQSSVKAEQLEAANRRIQRQLEQVEARFKLQSQELQKARGISFVETPNSRMMQIMEQKRILQIQHAKLMSHVSQQNQIKVQLEQKFKAMLDDKAKYVEKIDQLQRIVHAKEMDLLKHLQLREESIRDLIALNKKLEKQLKIINQKLSAEHKISTKVLEENLAKLQGQLAKLRRQNLQLRDEIEDLEDELIDRSRHKSAKGTYNTGSRSRFQASDENEDKYMLRTEGERLKEELYYLENSNQKLKQQLRQLKDQSVHSVRSGDSHNRRLGHSRVFVGIEERQRGHAVQDRLSEKVKYLQRQRHTLYQRLKILSVFSRIDTTNHAFIQNLNRVLDNILAFLNESDEFSESIITYGNFISQISESVSSDNYERYFQNVQDFLKDLFLRTFESKNEILARQAGQLIHFRQQMSELVNEQIDFIEQQERGAPRSVYSQRVADYDRGHYSEPAGMASFIALQHLFRLYVRAKSPEVLEQIAQLLNVTQLGGLQV